MKSHHDLWVQEGYEGAMVRLLDGHYAQGQRSSHLLKVKEFDETEFTFIRFETGQREEDLLAVCCVTDGRCFRAKVFGSREEKRLLAATPEKSLEYKKYTVKHFGWTDDKLPRFPIGKSFRDYE
jgi:ATP-dependent DNA ligase